VKREREKVEEEDSGLFFFGVDCSEVFPFQLHSVPPDESIGPEFDYKANKALYLVVV